MTEKESMRMALLLLQRGNVEKAKEAEAFVCGGNQASDDKHGDGIYLVVKDGAPILFTGSEKADNCVGVAVKMGSRAVTVALHDAADGEDVTLTAADDKTDWDGYKDSCLEATADWAGVANTEHLRKIGLNPAIVLEPGQYIPSMGEMKLIQLFRKELNEALRSVGGDELPGEWYWTSTEYSATYAWRLGLGYGTMGNGTKASFRYRVRPVSAFIS
jgi:hypothetical protein